MMGINPVKVFWRKVENQVFVCDAITGDAYQLEGSAGFIWELLAAGKNPEEIIFELAREYDVIQNIAAKDVKELLGQFKGAGLID